MEFIEDFEDIFIAEEVAMFENINNRRSYNSENRRQHVNHFNQLDDIEFQRRVHLNKESVSEICNCTY